MMTKIVSDLTRLAGIILSELTTFYFQAMMLSPSRIITITG